MGFIFNICIDTILITFDLAIFLQLTRLRSDKLWFRALICTFCAAFFAAYIVAAYVFHMPDGIASFAILSVPCFVLFFIASKHRDARYVVTFCFIDTITLIITFLTKALAFFGGTVGGILAVVAVALISLISYLLLRPYFGIYREVIEVVRHGWIAMMVSGVLIYLALVFAEHYPTPMLQRPEYVPVFIALSVTAISFYVVFTTNLIQKKRLREANNRLEEEKRWHSIAYRDALTGVENRMAYIEHINTLERELERDRHACTVIFDIDDFKSINDLLGHHAGDEVLKSVASFVSRLFAGTNYSLFRIGGDEFAVVILDMDDAELLEILSIFKNGRADGLKCRISYGFAFVNFEHNNAFETAFVSADQAMYDRKRRNKSQVDLKN